MLSDNSSTDSIVENYERDGVVRVRGMLSPEDVATAQREVARISATLTPQSPKEKVIFEPDGTTVRNLWHIEQDSRFFDALWQRSDILGLVAKLVHGEPVFSAVETFNKPARVGSGVPPHQDNAYFCQSPPDMLTVWVALDAATMENGPIYYAKGTHRGELQPHRPSGVNGNSMGLAVPFDKSNLFIGTLEPGDAVIHHCQTIHYSAPNKTDHSRCGLLLVYRGKNTKSDPVLAEAYAKARNMRS
jgi:phytanoyl-CoA hydroxylase